MESKRKKQMKRRRKMIDGTSVLAIVIICLIIVLLFIYFRLGRMIDLLGEKKQELEKEDAEEKDGRRRL